MTKWWSLPVSCGAWLGLWAWMLRDGFYRGGGTVTPDELMIVCTVLVIFGFLMSAAISRDALTYDERRRLVWWPVSLRERRHNARARLLRREAGLEGKAKRCDALIDQLSEGWGGDPLREPVLAAERDEAKRRAEMLVGDIKRLEAHWEHEDREREYRSLTRG